MPAKNIKVLVVGVGRMGQSHATAYQELDGFELVGLMSRSHPRPQRPAGLVRRRAALRGFRRGAARRRSPTPCRSTAGRTRHAAYALKAFDAGCHVFMEKPIATNVADAEKVVAAARDQAASW